MRLEIDTRKLVAEFGGQTAMTKLLNEAGFQIGVGGIHNMMTRGRITMRLWLDIVGACRKLNREAPVLENYII